MKTLVRIFLIIILMLLMMYAIMGCGPRKDANPSQIKLCDLELIATEGSCKLYRVTKNRQFICYWSMCGSTFSSSLK